MERAMLVEIKEEAMNQKTQEAVLEILETTKVIKGERYDPKHSLNAADWMMQALFKDAKKKSLDVLHKPVRWALYDGYNSRPKCYGGLIVDSDPDPDVIQAYDDAYELGREMSMRSLPA